MVKLSSPLVSKVVWFDRVKSVLSFYYVLKDIFFLIKKLEMCPLVYGMMSS